MCQLRCAHHRLRLHAQHVLRLPHVLGFVLHGPLPLLRRLHHRYRQSQQLQHQLHRLKISASRHLLESAHVRRLGGAAVEAGERECSRRKLLDHQRPAIHGGGRDRHYLRQHILLGGNNNHSLCQPDGQPDRIRVRSDEHNECEPLSLPHVLGHVLHWALAMLGWHRRNYRARRGLGVQLCGHGRIASTRVRPRVRVAVADAHADVECLADTLGVCLRVPLHGVELPQPVVERRSVDVADGVRLADVCTRGGAAHLQHRARSHPNWAGASV